MNLPWAVVDLTDAWRTRERGYRPWGITDCWGVVIALFEFENHAREAVDAVNEFCQGVAE